MLTLAFDTSSKTAAVALLRDSDILYDVVINTGLPHSEVLLVEIDKALRERSLKIKDVDLFACTIGPGSFTGLRIGVSTLKGLMLATGKPAAGISSLAALALNAGNTSKLICSVMDAGRGHVYTAFYRYDKNKCLEQIGVEKVIQQEDMLSNIDEEVYLIGEQSVNFSDFIGKKEKKIIINLKLARNIKASSVGILGIKKYSQKELCNKETLTPVYLRPADAQPKKSLFEKIQF
jgi:tRNA threonylcarbamoyladenosine biosynthesis protein TsaB